MRSTYRKILRERRPAAVGLLLVAAAPTAFAQVNSTITNFNNGAQVIKTDVAGNSVDAHDGKIALFNGTYYLYGTAYNCGFVWQKSGTPFCGFKTYSSPDLVHWTDQGLLFDPTSSTWQSKCDGSTYGCFRPKVIYNASTKLYVLWFNAYDNTSSYHVFTSSSPTGPFTQVADPTLAINASRGPGLNNGDEDLFVDTNGIAYIAYTDWGTGGGRIVVEQLNSSYTSGTGNYSLTPTSSTEAPGLFKNGSTYYITYSNPNCGYCGGTGTAYMTATNPIGTWTLGSQISSNSCGGQPSFVSTIPTTSGTAYLYGSDLWTNGNPNEAAANFYWAPLTFGANGSISPMTCQNSVSMSLSTGSAGSQSPLPPDIDATSGVSGFTPWCDVGGQYERSQAFVPSRSGILTSVSLVSFQQNTPNQQLEVDIDATNGSSQPTGSPLYTTLIPIASIGWSPRYLTIHPNIVVTAGTQYAYVLKSSTTGGCYGVGYNDSDPYTAGGEEYSSNSGASFSLETNRSGMFYTTVNGTVDLPTAELSGYTYCAAEGATCSFSGSRTVAYGAGRYVAKTFSNSLTCGTSAFGTDPNYGVVKSCYVAPAGGPAGYSLCANENGTCSFSGSMNVAYGANGAFTYKVLSNGTACTNTVFGDPDPGVVKACYTLPAGSPPPSGGWTQCAGESGQCTAAAGAEVAYGANGAFNYTPSNGNLTCSTTSFSGDPNYGVVKACYARTGVPTGYTTECSSENGTCSFTGFKTVAYGAQGSFIYKSFTNTTPCTNAAFGGDPIPGVVKACYTTP